jgi:hypothetical protein
VVVEVSEHAAGGWLRASRVVPVVVTLREVPADRRRWRLVCRQLAADARVRQAALDAPVDPHPADGWATVRSRLSAIRTARRRDHPRALQPSLFDRRALRAAGNRAIVDGRWDDWQARLERRLDSAGRRLATTRVVAVLPLGDDA